MKNWKNILLTALALLLLVGFAWTVTSPTLTEEAMEAHMNLDAQPGTEDESEDDLYDFL